MAKQAEIRWEKGTMTVRLVDQRGNVHMVGVNGAAAMTAQAVARAINLAVNGSYAGG